MNDEEQKPYAEWCNECYAENGNRASICTSCKQLTFTARKTQRPYHFKKHPFDVLHGFFKKTTLNGSKT